LKLQVHQPIEITGDKEVDDRLSSFPVIIAVPQNINENTPVVFGLQVNLAHLF